MTLLPCLGERQSARRSVSVIVIALLAWVLLAAPAAAAGRGPIVVFTVDVESNESFSLPAQVDARCGANACGLMEIARLLGEHHWAGTFFLNVYQHRQWGEATLRDIATRLQDAGQDVGLHTHPQWAYDPDRWAMYQYDVDEQTAIVRDGIQLLQAWTGKPVVAHRAGGYSADSRTLEALERNGVLLDSSEFWQYPTTRLDGLGLPRNTPSTHRHVTEIPVTVYFRDDTPSLFARLLPPVSSVRKIDPNWLTSADEMRTAVDQVVAARLPVLVLFLHSFSFMTADRDKGPQLDAHALQMFRATLDYVSQLGLQVATMRELAAAVPTGTDVKDAVPHVAVPVDALHYAWRKSKALPRGKIGIGFALVAAAAAVLLLRRRTAKRDPVVRAGLTADRRQGRSS